MTRAKDRFLKLRFYTPIGVADLRWTGSTGRGRWLRVSKRWPNDKNESLASRFANNDGSEEEVEKFVRRWGPLEGNPDDGTTGFNFTLEAWRLSQASFRSTWKAFQKYGRMSFEFNEPTVLDFDGTGFILRCNNLWTFMMLEMLQQPERLRLCIRSHCTHPYFIASHGKAQYCAMECSNWAQSQHKLQWHEKQRQVKLKQENE